MAKFEDIKKANESIRTTDIKGKEYAEVNQRVKAFRMVYPEGTIETYMLSNENGVCIFKAEVYDGDNLLATGHAYEKEGSSFINKTSFIENAETSAIGRAVGLAGFGIDTSICSAEELKNAKLNQAREEVESMMGDAEQTRISDSHVKILREKAKKLDVSTVMIAEKYGHTSIEDLTEAEYGRAMNALATMKGEQ